MPWFELIVGDGDRSMCAAYSEILLGCEAEQSQISCHLGKFSLLFLVAQTDEAIVAWEVLSMIESGL